MKPPTGACVFLAFTLSFLGLAGATHGAAAPHTGPLALVRVGERLYLQEDSARLLVEGREEKVVPRPGGWKLVLRAARGEDDGVPIFRSGRLLARVSLARLRDEWLQRDALWGPGKAGNNMRYMHQSAGGIGGFLAEAFPTSAGWVGVLNWGLLGPSGQPVGARHLVRIPAAARPAIEPVRILRGGASEPYQDNRPRLFLYAGKLLLWEPGELSEIGPRGERLRRFLRLPDGVEPYAFLQNRWLVRALQDAGRGTRIDVVDLRSRSVRLLLDEPPVDRGYRTTGIREADDTTRTLLLQTEADVESARTVSLLSVPSGTRRFLRVPWAETIFHLWRGYLITTDENGYTAYDARTLKLVKRLPLPAAALSGSNQEGEARP